jgi:hypothetical protein
MIEHQRNKRPQAMIDDDYIIDRVTDRFKPRSIAASSTMNKQVRSLDEVWLSAHLQFKELGRWNYASRTYMLISSIYMETEETSSLSPEEPSGETLKL